jgi:aquaporin NIP
LTRAAFTAEVIGTFALVFVGTGAAIVNDLTRGTVTHVGVALAFGLVVLAMIYAVGEVSGAHFNPAVTAGFALAGRLPAAQVVPYVAAQCVGAIAASALLRLLFPASRLLGATLPAGSDAQSFAMEVVLTALLMFVILSVSIGAKEKGLTAGIVVGGVIAMEALVGGPVSGASMNPARSLAPALVSMHFQSLWIYLLAPLLGVACAVFACRSVHGRECCQAQCG